LCAIVVAIYTAYILAFVWILPLFPAEPKWGPVVLTTKVFSARDDFHAAAVS